MFSCGSVTTRSTRCSSSTTGSIWSARSIYGIIAAWFLVRIDPLGALVGIAPLLLVGWGNGLIASLARRFRQRLRDAASAVSDFLASAFEASLTVKVAGAQPGVLRRLDELNASRAKAAVGDHVWNEVQWTINSTMADVFVGLALVVAARGRLTAGEITQFAAYLLGLVWLPMRIGGLIAGRRRFEVSADRLDALCAAPSLAAARSARRPARPAGLGGPPWSLRWYSRSSTAGDDSRCAVSRSPPAGCPASTSISSGAR